jgi:hypothetical protein
MALQRVSRRARRMPHIRHDVESGVRHAVRDTGSTVQHRPIPPPEPRQYHHNFKNLTVAAAVLPPLLVPSLTLLLLMPIPLWRPPLMLQHPQHRHYVTTVAIAGTAVANTALPLPLLLLRPTLLCRRCCCRCC